MYILMIPSSLRCIFFFYCYATHRDLHSFPTRRSSDLADRDLAVAAQGHVAVPAYAENCRAMNSWREQSSLFPYPFDPLHRPPSPAGRGGQGVRTHERGCAWWYTFFNRSTDV